MKHKKDWPAMNEGFGSTLKSSWAKTILSQRLQNKKNWYRDYELSELKPIIEAPKKARKYYYTDDKQIQYRTLFLFQRYI